MGVSPTAQRDNVPGDSNTGRRLHQVILAVLYAGSVLFIAKFLHDGWAYYRLPLIERAHSDMHMSWKPGGETGHGLGIAGGLLLILLLYYVARKNFRFMSRWGNIRYVLDYHIWMGITALFVITLHATFKTGGIVGIAYWSVVLVTLSGFLGRYVYMQIPHSSSGAELSQQATESLRDEIISEVDRSRGVSDHILDRIRAIEDAALVRGHGELRTLIRVIVSDLKLPWYLWSIDRKMAAAGGLSAIERRRIVFLTLRRVLLSRRASALQTMRRILHHWHVFHRPVAVVMFVILALHVVISVAFGYRWIW